MKNNLIVLDCETGGFDPNENPITEVAAVIVEPLKMQLLDSYETYVQQYSDKWIITKKALEITRIDYRKIQSGKPFKKVCADLIQLFKSANKTGKEATIPILVGHNVGFDIKFLEMLFELCGKYLFDYIHPVPIDTMHEVKSMERGLLNKDENIKNTLSACCDRFNINLKNAHGAMSDVQATHKLLSEIFRRKQIGYSIVSKSGQISESDIKQERKILAEKKTRHNGKPFFEF